MTISEFQEHVKELAQKFPDSTVERRLMYLTTEVGELAKEVLKLGGKVDETAVKENIGLEMYDIVWNVFELANQLGINLEEAFARKIEINATRSWKL